MPPHTFSLFSNFLMVMDVTIRENLSTLTKNEEEVVNVEVQMGDELFVYSTACTVTGILERMQGAYEARKESYPSTGLSRLCSSESNGYSVLNSIEPYELSSGVTRQFQVNTPRLQSHQVKQGSSQRRVEDELERMIETTSAVDADVKEAIVGAERLAKGVLLKDPYNTESGLMPRDLVLSFLNMTELLNTPVKRRKLVEDALVSETGTEERFYEIYEQSGVTYLTDTGTRWSLPSFNNVKDRFERWQNVYDRLKLCLQYSRWQGNKEKMVTDQGSRQRAFKLGAKNDHETTLTFYVQRDTGGRARSRIEVQRDVEKARDTYLRDGGDKQYQKNDLRKKILERGRTALATVTIEVLKGPPPSSTAAASAIVRQLSVRCTDGPPPNMAVFKRAIAKALLRLLVDPRPPSSTPSNIIDWSFRTHCRRFVKMNRAPRGGDGGSGKKSGGKRGGKGKLGYQQLAAGAAPVKRMTKEERDKAERERAARRKGTV